MPEPPPRPSLPLWKRLLFSVVVLALFLLLLEAGLSLGARSWLAVRARPLAQGDLTVFCVGDSVTYGTGVGPEETWPARLQALLDARTPGAVAVRTVASPASPFTDLLYDVDYIRRRPGETGGRRVVLVLLGHNTFLRWGSDPFAGFQPPERSGSDEAAPGPRLLRIFRWAMLALTHEPPEATLRPHVEWQLQEILAQFQAVLPGETIYVMTYALPGEPPPEMAEYQAEVIRRTRLVQADGNEVLRRVARQLGIGVIDVEVAIGLPDTWSAAWFQDNIHLTAAGYRRMAETVARALVSEGELPPRALP